MDTQLLIIGAGPFGLSMAAEATRRGIPHATVQSCTVHADGSLKLTLTTGSVIDADRVILATGYKVDMPRLPYLAAGNILADLALDDGFPVLDDHVQTSIPGLYVTSMPATKAFGAFFAFTVSVRAAARIVCHAIAG